MAATQSPAIASPPPACAEPWKRLLFDVRGDAFVCCVQKINEVFLGQTPPDTPEQIWNGRRARLVREAMFGGSAPSCCRDCYKTSGRGENPVIQERRMRRLGN